MSRDNFSEKSNRPSHIAYTVDSGKGEKNHWHKIGAAWPTKGDGLNIQLTAIPLDGNIALRSREELEKMRAERGTRPEQAPKHDYKP